MTEISAGPEVLSPAVVHGFRLDQAASILLTGSRAEGLADPSSDLDILALYYGTPPASVPHPDVIDMSTSLGTNWIGQVDGREVNVEGISLETLARLSSRLAVPFDTHHAPILQELEVRLLNRIRTGDQLTLDGAPGGSYLQELRARYHMDRLPALVLVMNYCGAAAYLHLAVERANDPLGCQIALASVAEGIALSALALHGTVLYGMKKAASALRRLEQQQPDPPVRAADIASLLLDGAPADRLPAARAALLRVHAAVQDRAAADPAWTQASVGLGAAAALPDPADCAAGGAS